MQYTHRNIFVFYELTEGDHLGKAWQHVNPKIRPLQGIPRETLNMVISEGGGLRKRHRKGFRKGPAEAPAGGPPMPPPVHRAQKSARTGLQWAI